jgi:hypothetical protein
MSHRHIAVTLLLASEVGWAGCGDSIVSRGGKPEQFVDISDDGCLYSELMINGQFRFSEECKPYGTSGQGFACRKGDIAPLSGVTYVPVYDAKPHCGGKKPDMRYKCVRGCKPSVNKYLYVEPYEC